MKFKLHHLLAASLAALSLGVVACGDDEETTAASKQSTGAVEKNTMNAADEGTESGSASLRAGLTALLQEHVYLAGTAFSAGVGEGLDSKQFKAAAATLDDNSKGLADAIGGVYGDDAGAQFLELWRAHIGMFVDYVKGAATKDEDLKAKAAKDLDGYRADFGAFLASANPNLTKEAVAEALVPHVETVVATADALVAGDTDVYDNLREAASHMPDTANVLAGAIAKQFPDKFSGSTESGPSELRSGLTAQLQEHVYLAGIAFAGGVGNGLDSKEFKASAATLDDNSKALADSIGSAYGDDARDQFLELWRAHIGMFVEYVKGAATKDKALMEKAAKDLDGYRNDFGAFLASANPNLTKEAIADALKPHVATVVATANSLVAGDTDVYDNLRKAASHMPDTADVLAGAIVKQFPDKFPSS